MPKILIVEDETEVANLCRSFFEEQGYDSQIAQTGTKAEELLKREDFCLILTDIVFFPEQERLVEYSEPQSIQKINDGYSIEIQRSNAAAKIPSRLKGVLYTPQGWDTSAELRALLVDVSLDNNL